jgi:predicted naringenin-chalcone synthase
VNLKDIALSDFKIVLPRYHGEQSQLNAWTAACHGLNLASDEDRLRIEKLFQRYALNPTKIATRYFECPDALRSPQDHAQNSVYRFDSSHPEGVSIHERAHFFLIRAQEIFAEFYASSAPQPDHLIHVTCTGYVAPSPAQRWVVGWAKPTAVTHAYHMGCYASLPASRMAQVFATSLGDTARVDVIHTEMCSLHLNPADHSAEQMVVQSLFADGHIKYSARPARDVDRGFGLRNFLERVIPDSAEDMTWVPAPWGLRMTLSREVPTKIAQNLRPFLSALAESSGENLGDLLKHAVFAVHPGGPKIIDAVQEVLELSKEQVALSHKVLRERGNMSSATLPHIWKEILDLDLKSGTRVVSLAFGPGLTLFGAVFVVV